MALGVSVLTVAVVSQLLDGSSARVSGRLTASAVGLLMLLEGAVVLFTNSDHAEPTAVIHGGAMLAAGAGLTFAATVALAGAALRRTRTQP